MLDYAVNAYLEASGVPYTQLYTSFYYSVRFMYTCPLFRLVRPN